MVVSSLLIGSQAGSQYWRVAMSARGCREEVEEVAGRSTRPRPLKTQQVSVLILCSPPAAPPLFCFFIFLKHILRPLPSSFLPHSSPATSSFLVPPLSSPPPNRFLLLLLSFISSSTVSQFLLLLLCKRNVLRSFIRLFVRQDMFLCRSVVFTEEDRDSQVNVAKPLAANEPCFPLEVMETDVGHVTQTRLHRSC